MIEQAKVKNEQEGLGYKMGQLCSWYDISRQAHYQQRWRDQTQVEDEEQVLALVRGIRERHPRLGGRKLHHELQEPLAKLGIEIGRDRFCTLLARHDLLVPPLRRQRRTTWAGLWRCPNRLEGLLVKQVQQAWVADITYLETQQGFCYLCLVTDLYSHTIVGFDVSTSLAVEGALRALNMAIDQTRGSLAGLIHHSDHGVQYTCHAYRDRLHAVKAVSSMGQVGNCYDNAVAERLNGILKQEYGLGDLLFDLNHATLATQQAVWLYNHERPHCSLALQKPMVVHLNSQFINSNA